MKTQAGSNVIVTGSRTITNYRLMTHALELSGMKIQELVRGGARGVHPLGERYARKHGFSIRLFPEDWEAFDKPAGHRSHERMVEYVDVLIASGAECKRATHVIEIVERDGLAVYVDSRSAA